MNLRLTNVLISLFIFIILPLRGAMAQTCVPCATHCEMQGAAANAACVQSNIDPVRCGPGPGPRPQSFGNDSVGSLPASHAMVAAGQTCTTQGICYREGASVQKACLAACFICTPSTVHPDFLLLSILYAPPGNASTASFGQSTSSGVSYGIAHNINEGTSAGISISGSFSASGDGTGFSISLQNGSSNGGGNSDQFSAVTTATGTYNLKPGQDPIDHTQDIFLLWLNPIVTLTKSDQITLAAAISSGQVQMSVQAVSAGQLMNGIPAEKLAPTKICPTSSTCYELPGLGSLTKADITAILAQDPFLSGGVNQALDPSRYIYLQSNPLENTTVAANVTQAFNVSDSSTSTHTTTRSSGSSEGITSGISAKAMGAGISLTQSDTWTWSQTVSQGVSSGHAQQASVTLASTSQNCCGINKNVTCEVSIWEDMLYRTFVFVPQPETCQAPLSANRLAMGRVESSTEPKTKTSLWGTLTHDNAAVIGATVAILNAHGGVLYRIVTDHYGRYFSGEIASGPVTVQVGAQTIHETIVPEQVNVLDIKL